MAQESPSARCALARPCATAPGRTTTGFRPHRCRDASGALSRLVTEPARVEPEYDQSTANRSGRTPARSAVAPSTHCREGLETNSVSPVGTAENSPARSAGESLETQSFSPVGTIEGSERRKAQSSLWDCGRQGRPRRSKRSMRALPGVAPRCAERTALKAGANGTRRLTTN